MANTVSKHNQNTVDLAILLNDALVGADNGIKAAAGGQKFSAAKLNYYLMVSYSWIVDLFNMAFGSDYTEREMPDVVETHSFTASSSGVILNKNRLVDLYVTKSGNIYVEIPYADLTVLDRDKYRDYVFSISKGKIYIGERSSGTMSVINTGTYTLHYLKAERITTAVTATATSAIIAGLVTGVTVVEQGSDYQSAPAVTFSGGGGSNAAATAVLTNGKVSSVTVTNAGSNYVTAPTVTIAAPGGTAGSNVAINTVPDITLDQQWIPACVRQAAYLAALDAGVREDAMKFKEGLKLLLPKETHPFL